MMDIRPSRDTTYCIFTRDCDRLNLQIKRRRKKKANGINFSKSQIRRSRAIKPPIENEIYQLHFTNSDV